MTTAIRAARAGELARLQEIEAAAGRLFAAIGMDDVAGHPPPPIEGLRTYQEEGRAWVAVDGEDRPVAYLVADVVDGAVHVCQVSVDPAWGRRGVGRDLVERAAEWGRSRGFDAMTLTTFAGVPWNGPYYERCGFVPVAGCDLTPGLRAVLEQERPLEIHGRRRIAMRRAL